MYSFRDSFLKFLLHAVVATPIALWGGFLLMSADFFGLAPLLVAAIILAFPFAEMLAEPISGLGYPGGRRERPPPMYSVQEAKRAKGLYEEAMAGLEEILLKYPQEARAYIALVEIAIVDLKDPERASDIYDRGIGALTKETDRHALTQMYLGNCSRLTEHPEWLRKEQERILSTKDVQLPKPTVPEHFQSPGIQR